jgi:hypothetical protein
VATGETRNLTADIDHHGFSRAYYLSNGDLLLCGPTSGPEPSADRPEAGRFTGVMSVFRAPFDQPPVPLGMPCWEGMATSRTSLRIAWNRSDIDYTDSDLVDRVVNGITEIWTGELRYDGDRVVVVDARKVLDRDAFGHLAVFEVQGFRPPSDDELILTAYAYQGGEVLGLDLGSGTLRNYSNSSAYEEAEGVDATGDAVYVERRHGGVVARVKASGSAPTVHHGRMVVALLVVVLLTALGLAFIAAGTRRSRRLPDAVCQELRAMPTRQWKSHVVDLELSDGRVVEGVYVAYGKYVALIGGRMRSEHYSVGDVVHARPHPDVGRR